ncbi:MULTISPECIES: hypothetical protein [unclassified Lentimonas]|uniref:hypothetical protein n=1 Tax=unclassified Lentimonas TaxID=2630993 RepID=UPI00132075B4|nr:MULTISPECIES: hypothetical protein [unclassified Lentimonas]CAA6691298.1 Unannotated [Lentimonas sp. CC19]CAA6694877.1 Unannotated [Lentimonas sp. CC10]CAA7071931.1 Unannotated [Lentimonas sp. CC11]
MNKINPKKQTHRETILKFSALVALLLGYFVWMSWKYDASTGFGLALLTWSFFVLCTPIADGGFIVAFPVRLLFGVKMALTQVIIWFVAVGINLVMLWKFRADYQLTFITSLLEKILTVPYPYWSILIISAAGTLLSIYFGDEMMDVSSHREREKHHAHGMKLRILVTVGLGLLAVIAYYHLLSGLHIELPKD